MAADITLKYSYVVHIKIECFVLSVVSFCSFVLLFYLHVVHDGLEEPSQSAALLLHYRIHFSRSEKKTPHQNVVVFV